MGKFDVLLAGIHSQSCGLCCSKNTKCENCLRSTVLGNGFDESTIDQVRGLSHINSSSFEPWRFSEMCKKLYEIRDQGQR